MINSGGNNVWFVRAPLSLGGVQVTSQMTIIKTSHNELVLISPVKIDALLKSEVEALGQVAWIVAPNNFHHLFIDSAKQAFPEAKIICPEGLPKKLKNLGEHAVIDVNDINVWGADLEVLRIYSGGLGDEHVFFHGPSQTLILTDLFMWFEEKTNLATKIFAALMGVNSDAPKMSRMMKFVYRDKAVLRESFRKVLEWDFNRVLLAHSRNVELDAKFHIREAMSFLIPVERKSEEGSQQKAG